MHSFSKFISAIALMSLLMCGFVFSGTLGCNASGDSSELVGGYCSTEHVTTPTIWSWSDAHLAIAAKKVALPVLALVALLTIPLIQKRHDPSHSFWTRIIEPTLLGYKHNVFIPQLSSAHGW
ncbi:hypothetical protein HOI18_03425 [Candidatus Uhrbacteria bacterium]|jgi:hypothetical protein|nr:hypothetical protein [Candidatus Uhrbacteria bacterium]